MLLAALATGANAALILAMDGWRQAQSNPTPTAGSAASPAPTPATTATVTIKGFQFLPAEVVLKKGGTVTFTNEDSTPHTATPSQGAQFTGTGRLKKGESKTVQFDTVGEHNYFCDIHPSMVGKVMVM
jgi:plastocyanin